MKHYLLLLLCVVIAIGASAQRQTDKLGRGLVAVKAANGIFCSWRINAEEYYDVTYNIYRDGTKLNEEPLAVSNYIDMSGTSQNKYSVTAVIRGVEQQACDEVTPWENNYKEISIKHDESLKSTYIPNDACCVDVDGDGEMEILIKYDNQEEMTALYPKTGNNGEYSLFECVKQEGTVLWWINCGPNMGDFQNNEQNIVGYDWDKDGKSEVIVRLCEGATIHMADGTTYQIGADGKNGTAWTNYRISKGSSSVEWFTYYGNEYLLYLNGETGKPYQCVDFPLKRYEAGETDLRAAWGDGYGHRSNKFFFGAPVLDGRNASIFLARGIYTRHKMVALDVNPATHELTQRWIWTCNTAGPWYGQGYHNYSIADVDFDGRDEIVFGSMVIDDNGKGLSTTGLGHGDAHHVGDFNPFVHGLEFFACNEDKPNNNYRDATTSKIYYRNIGSSDDGRSMCGNFTDNIIGAIACSSRETGISCVANKNVGISCDGVATNFRIYWDGDLCDESFNGSALRNSAGIITKYGSWTPIETLSGSLTNNDTKATPCLQGDIFGDWREEIIMRTIDNKIRIYTTTISTPWRNYTLWHDCQYRNAMVTQMCGYNQPPHVSYYLGEVEGITMAPPALTMTNRTEISNGSTITTSTNDKEIIICEPNDMTVSVTDGISPYILTINTPTWVQGTAPSECTTKDVEIVYQTYTHTLNGGAFTGKMRLVKQGDGVLNLPNVEQTYEGSTDIWAGVVNFDGTMKNSSVWMNRFAELNSSGIFNRTVEMNYASILRPGGVNNAAEVTIDTLVLNYGAQLEVDLFSDETKSDVVKCKKLKINTIVDKGGYLPYTTPIVNMVPHYSTNEFMLSGGKYLICEYETLIGDINNIALIGTRGNKASLQVEDNKLYIVVEELRKPTTIYWTGSENDIWDLGETTNFIDKNGEKTYFVTRDTVVFDDNLRNNIVKVAEVLQPTVVKLNNNINTITISGDSLSGVCKLEKNGTAKVVINNVNSFTGGTIVNNGTLTISQLAYDMGIVYGVLGDISSTITLNGGKLETIGNVNCSQQIFVTGNDTIIVNTALLLTEPIKAATTTSSWYKFGNGTLTIASSPNDGELHICQGIVQGSELNNVHSWPSKVYLEGGTMKDVNDIDTYSTNKVNVIIPEGKTGSWYMDERCDYNGTLTGSGTLNLYVTGPRGYLKGNWSNFSGTIKTIGSKTGSYDPYLYLVSSFGYANATINLGVTTTHENVKTKIGALTGSSDMVGTTDVVLGLNNTDFTYSGSLSGNKLIKKGTGICTLKNTQTAIGGSEIYVYEGALNLNNIAYTNRFFGQKTIRVSGGTLSGRTKVYDIYVENGGTLSPGNITATQAGYIEANRVYVYDGSNIDINIRTGKNNETSHSYVVASSLLMKGTLNVSLASTYKPQVGDECSVWNVGALTLEESTLKVNLPELPEGLKWDTSELLTTKGLLRIVSAESAVQTIAANDYVVCEMYNVVGVKVAEFKAVRNTVVSEANSYVSQSGTYIVRMRNENATESIKIFIK